MKVPMAHWTLNPSPRTSLDRLDLDLCRVIEVLADIEHRHADLLAADDLVRLRAASRDIQQIFQQHAVARVSRLGGLEDDVCHDRIA